MKLKMFEYQGMEIYLGETDQHGIIPVYCGSYKVASLIDVYLADSEEGCQWYCTDKLETDGLPAYSSPREAIEGFLDSKIANMKLH